MTQFVLFIIILYPMSRLYTLSRCLMSHDDSSLERHLFWSFDVIFYHFMRNIFQYFQFKLYSRYVITIQHLTSYASYILVVFSYLCSSVFIWYCCCFRGYKNWKKWLFNIFVFFYALRHLPMFSDIFTIVSDKIQSEPSTIYSSTRYT